MSARRAGAVALLAACLAGLAIGHPMGNFSVGQYAALTPARDGVTVAYVLDLAEMPTYNLRAEMGIGPAAPLAPDELERYRERTAAAWLAKLTLTADARPLALAPTGGRAVLTPGAGGLPTVRFEVTAHAQWPAVMAAGEHTLSYRDDNFPDRVGWKEVVARAGEGVAIVRASAPSEDRSAALTKYPEESTAAPSAVRAAEVTLSLAKASTAAPAGSAPPAAAGPDPIGSDPLRSAALAIAFGTAALALVGVAAALSASRSRARGAPTAADPPA